MTNHLLVLVILLLGMILQSRIALSSSHASTDVLGHELLCEGI